MKAVAKPLPGGKGYIIEWMIRPNPCLEVKPGVFWSPALGETRLGLNLAVQDAFWLSLAALIPAIIAVLFLHTPKSAAQTEEKTATLGQAVS